MSFSTILIGDETLTAEAGAQLLARGHRIAALVTHSAELRAWAAARHIAVEPHGPDLAQRLPQVDWLLSVANLTLLPASVVARAEKGAVNFHDGPLPEHAGLNAPVWALLAGESQHGISWHLIEGGVDAGRILEARQFEIAENDTALTLNTRCFEAGLESFPAVLAQLETGLRPVAQRAVPGQMHRGADRPLAQGRLDFSLSMAAICRQVRALDHGRYWNPLCTAKIQTSTGVVNVGMAEPASGQGGPGQVLAADDAAGLVVACGDGAVRLSRLSCQSKGLPLRPASLQDPVLAPLTGAEALALTQALAPVAAMERQSRQALRALQPVTLPDVQGGKGAEMDADWRQVPQPQSPLHSQSQAMAVMLLAALRALGRDHGDIAFAAAGLPGYIADWAPLRIDGRLPLAEAVTTLAADLAARRAVPPVGWALDLMSRDAALTDLAMPQLAVSAAGPVHGAVLTISPEACHYDAARLEDGVAQALLARITHIAQAIAAALAAADAKAMLADMPLLTAAEHDLVVNHWNQTAKDHDRSLMLHTAFEAQVARSPDAPAIAFEGETLSYAALNARANRAAHVLREMGVGPGVLVGLCTRRSLDLVAGALAILKAGGAYVPMDPAYPADRLALFAEDSACPVIVTQADLSERLPAQVQKLELDRDPRLNEAPHHDPHSGVTPEDLAYLIYTSGSTGRPKGVMIEHRNVANFFTGMDEALAPEVAAAPGVWLAVTSLSFDISVLELFWTLARGFKVVISSDENRALVSSGPITSAKGMEFSLYYWGNDDGQGAKKYELLLEGARFADRNGFTALWTPERHFHAFGGPYPNPAVTGAAVAAVTQNLAVRAGSCVVPLHHPARVAEEWAVIDNLTNGRAGIAIASGWQPEDFVLRPENTPPQNKPALYAAAEQIRKLWRGEGVDFPKADGTPFTVVTQPRPVSKELPLWITTAGNPDTWRDAGRMGANVLTHLLGQSVAEVAEKITLYHQALRDAGHDPERFTVTLMLHTYIGQDREAVRRVAEAPMKAYLAAAVGLVKQYAWAFPAFKKPAGVETPMDIDLRSLSAEENEAILDFAFQRYFEESGLFGSVEDALARVEELKRIGVTEVACLIDYGIAPAEVITGFAPLAEVVRRANAGGGPAADDFSIAAQIARHGVTHLQCTPSMARMIAMNDDSRAALAQVQVMLVGGEALPGALVQDLHQAGVARLLNMYGPTETTIWSSYETVASVEPIANIGHALANQQLYVLDAARNPVPPGIEGELWIGGEGVTRGYWQRPELTAERFRPNPFHPGRMYQTGDLVRLRPDGKVDYIGRTDHQVKLRGYRIELGEIEALLEQQPGVRQAVVMAREDSPGDLRLVAYTTGSATEAALRLALTAELPAHMLPQHFVALDAFPLTPNRKVDRKALPKPQLGGTPAPAPALAIAAPEGAMPQSEAASPAAAASAGIEAQLAQIWARVLGVAKVSAHDNFFALGGHSLLAVQAHREIREALTGVKVSITDIFRFPVLSALAAHISGPMPAAVTPVAPRPLVAAPIVAPPQSAADAAPQQAPVVLSDSLAEAMSRRRAMRLARRGIDA